MTFNPQKRMKVRIWVMLKTRILIADDHTMVAEACKNLLEPEYEVVGIVGDGRAVVQAAEELKPDIVLMDIGMPFLNGLDAGHEIKTARPLTKLVYLTMNPDLNLAAEAFRNEASGYLLKTGAASELLVAVRTVLRDEKYLSPAVSKETIDSLMLRGAQLFLGEVRLSERQREVLQLLAEGKPMKEVATALKVTVRTVAFHKYRIMDRLRLKSNAELVQYAMRHHLIAT
jgi:DNA-binding NarL/FixJ family response regulator